MLQSEDRKKALDTVLAAIDKSFGEGAVFRQGDKVIKGVEWISTGSLSLDAALGGGWPRARIVEIFGQESVAKTTLALHAVANVQAAGGTAAFIDAEHSLEPSYAAAIGVDVPSLLVSQPDCGEQALEIVDMLVRSNTVDIIIVDSVAALVPRAELDGEMADAQVGLQARLMSKAMRKLSGVVMKSNCLLIFINQLRSKIGGFGYGPTTITSGGNALKFYTSQRVQLTKIGTKKKGDEIVGNQIQVKVVKNKVAPPYREAELCVTFGKGVNKPQELIDLGVKYEFVKKSGPWYSLDGKQIGQGAINAAIYLEQHLDEMNILRDKVRERLFHEASSIVQVGGEDD